MILSRKFFETLKPTGEGAKESSAPAPAATPAVAVASPSGEIQAFFEAHNEMKQKNSVQVSTINRIEKVMRQKVKEVLPQFEEMDVSQTLTTTQGEQALKSNPAIQEARALFKDYCAIVKIQQELANNRKVELEKTSIDLIRSKLKLAK